MKSLTHEEFIEKLSKENPKVQVIGTYINRQHKISISCRKCGKIIDVLPNNLFSHSGLCRECSKLELKPRTTKTHEEFIKELSEINPNIIVTGKYVNAKTKIEWKCRQCGNTFYSIPNSLKTASGFCTSCSGRISHDEYIRRVSDKNPNIQIVGMFVDSNTPIQWKCSRCGRISSVNPKVVPKLSGLCKQCQFEEKKEEFFERFQTLKNPPVLLSEYKGATQKILCRCNVCGYKWHSLPSVILTYKNPCPKCADVASRVKHLDFVNALMQTNPNIEVLGDYVTSKIPVLCRCKLCNYTWLAKPSELRKGKGCPECNHTGTSFVEQVLLLSLKKVFGMNEVLSRDRTAIKKELDIYIPSRKLAIEYGSWYWHKNRVKNDQDKGVRCAKTGILLYCVYDACKELDEIDTSCFCNTYFYKENLGENEILIKQLIIKLLANIGIEFSFSESSWKEIRNQAYINSRRKTTSDFINELSQINKTIKILGEYKGSHVPISVKCIKCGRIWDALPKELLKGSGCSFCYHKQQKDTQEVFIEKLKNINESIIVLGEYAGRRERIRVKCEKCGYEWNASANSLLVGKGCPKCGGYHSPRKREDGISEIIKNNPNIDILSEYKNTYTPIIVRCKTCGREWNITPAKLMKGSSCINCLRQSRRKTHEQFVGEMSIKHPNLEVIGEYQTAVTPIQIRCNTCGYCWETKPNTLLSGHGCPKCAKK